MAARIKTIHKKTERNGLAAIVGKNPVVVMGTSLYWGDTPREVGSFADELKKKRPSTNCMKAFSGTFGSPAIMAF